MASDIFVVWFEKFCDELKKRPLLLLFDGHLTHVSVLVIERAMEEKIFILKFPPHVTDVLQSLNVACFRPLKREWERKGGFEATGIFPVNSAKYP